MSPLHTRGYRPPPGARAHRGPYIHFAPMTTREAWEASWLGVREGEVSQLSLCDILARACLDAREAGDRESPRGMMRE